MRPTRGGCREHTRGGCTSYRHFHSLIAALLVAIALVVPARLPAQDLVDLNSASAAELEKLPGIGQKRAKDIIRYRVEHGFRRKTDLLRIKGVGRRIYAKLKSLVEVLPMRPAEAGEVAP